METVGSALRTLGDQVLNRGYPETKIGEGETKVNIKTVLKSSVAAAALFAIAAPVATTANAADDTFKTGNKNSLTMSGYVSRSLWYGDDGVNEHLFNTGGKTATTRVRWIAKGQINENVSMGSMI